MTDAIPLMEGDLEAVRADLGLTVGEFSGMAAAWIGSGPAAWIRRSGRGPLVRLADAAAHALLLDAREIVRAARVEATKEARPRGKGGRGAGSR